MKLPAIHLTLLALAVAACGLPTPVAPAADPPAQPAVEPVVPPSLGSAVLVAGWDEATTLSEILPVDPATGDPVAGYSPIPLGRHFSHAFSPDGRRLVAVSFPGESHRGGELHVIDLFEWKNTPLGIEFDAVVDVLAFDADGARLAVAAMPQARGVDDPPGSIVTVVDLASGTIAARARLAHQVTRLGFSPEGDSLLAYGQSVPEPGSDPVAWAARLRAGDLAVAWAQHLPGILNVEHRQVDGEPRYFWYQPAVALWPEGNALYIVHADADRLTAVDFTRRAPRAEDILPAQSWLEWLLARTAGVAHAKMTDGTIKQAALSPDGSRLYVAGQTMASAKTDRGQWEYTRDSLDLQVIDVATGALLDSLETEATEVSLSADGARLFLRGWTEPGASDPYAIPWTQVVDAETLETVATLEGYALVPARRLDGDPILLSNTTAPNGQQAVAALDPETLMEIHAWAAWHPGWIWPLTP